ncbi:hypothetical protein INT47_005970, partial [Mucor saturninus]
EVPATATSEPSNVAVVEAIGLAGPSHKTSVEVNRKIREFLWEPNFHANTPAEILANTNKPRWNTDVHFNVTPNKELVNRLLVVLERKFAGDGMRTKDLRDKLHKNFINRCKQEKISAAAKEITNTRSRRARRAGENHKRRTKAYGSNMVAINQEMGRDCANALPKEAMSGGESDDEVSETGRRRVIRTVRPSWRSDEYNRFIQVIDRFVGLQLGANSHQLLSRVYGRTVDVAVPTNLNPSLAQWALRHGL